MAAVEVICNVHQHEVCCITINQPGTRISTCSAKLREGGVLLPRLPKYSMSASTNFNVCVYLSRVLWYVFTAHRHGTSLQSSGEGKTPPTSTGEGPF